MDLRGTRDLHTLPEVYQDGLQQSVAAGSGSSGQQQGSTDTAGLRGSLAALCPGPRNQAEGSTPPPINRNWKQKQHAHFSEKKKDALTVDEGRIGAHPGEGGRGLVLGQSHQHIVPTRFVFFLRRIKEH